jgi:hypothetical protein
MNFRKWICGRLHEDSWLYGVFDCSRYEPEPPPPEPPPPDPPPQPPPVPEPGETLTRDRIWFYYDRLNRRMIEALQAASVKFYMEPWNELYIAEPEGADHNVAVHQWFVESFKRHGCPANRIICNTDQARQDTSAYRDIVSRFKALGVIVEHHGCASPEMMREQISRFGAGRKTYPNGDGSDPYARGINDGRPGYTEPSVKQAREMGRILRISNLFAYLHKNRRTCFHMSIKAADFSALGGLAEGYKSGR